MNWKKILSKIVHAIILMTKLILKILYKTLYGANLLCIIFDKVDGCIRNYDGTKYLTLFCSEKFGSIFNRIKYFIRVKSNIS